MSLFTADELKLLKKLGFQDSVLNISEDDDLWADIEDQVGDYLTLRCLDENYEPNEEGVICEAILDKLP